MRETLINQYNHTWKMFYKMVNDFDTVSWTDIGCSYITPARIAYHIIGGVDYYTENDNRVNLTSGKELNWKWDTASTNDLPTQTDINQLIHYYKGIADNWIRNCDFLSNNDKFTWTGSNNISIVYVLLRHMEYHIGELNLLLHISKSGNANDNWIKAFDEFTV